MMGHLNCLHFMGPAIDRVQDGFGQLADVQPETPRRDVQAGEFEIIHS